LQNEDVPMFGSIETLVSFSSVWYVCVVAGCKMMVWQGSYQVRCGRRKFREVMTEGFAAEKISSACFCFVKKRKKLLNLVFFFSIFYFKEKYETICCAMYSRRQSVYLKASFHG